MISKAKIQKCNPERNKKNVKEKQSIQIIMLILIRWPSIFHLPEYVLEDTMHNFPWNCWTSLECPWCWHMSYWSKSVCLCTELVNQVDLLIIPLLLHKSHFWVYNQCSSWCSQQNFVPKSYKDRLLLDIGLE